MVVKSGFHSKFNCFLGLILVLCALGAEWLSTSFMTVLARFYEAIISKDQRLFIRQLQFACFLSFAVAILKSVKKYCAQAVSLQWRCSTVKEIHEHFFGPYGLALRAAMASLDNLDQRVTQDVENLSLLYADLAEKVVVVPFIIIYYSLFLMIHLGWSVVLFAFIYFLVGTALGSMLMNRLVPVAYQQEVVEGNFRFFYCTIRTNHWIIVLLRGLQREKDTANALLEKIVANKSSFIKIGLSVDLFSSWFDYTGSIVNYAIVGYFIFQSQSTGSMASNDRLTVFATGSYALLYLINAFSSLIDTFKTVGTARGLQKRLSELLVVLKSTNGFDDNKDACDGSYSRLLDSDSSVGVSLVPLQHKYPYGQPTTLRPSHTPTNVLLSLTDFSVRSLDFQRVLLRGLSLSLVRGMRLLVTGPSGCGKSTLLTCLNLLIQQQNDNVVVGEDGGCAVNVPLDQFSVCSQTAYCFQGSLVDNVLYPDSFSYIRSSRNVMSKAGFSDTVEQTQSLLLHRMDCGEGDETDGRMRYIQREVRDLLLQVGLHCFLPELEANNERNWSATTSEGERQRLCVARLLYHKPTLCFLDEATSAVDEDAENKLYELIVSRCDTIISIGHRSTLRKYHTHELKIDPHSQNCTLAALS